VVPGGVAQRAQLFEAAPALLDFPGLPICGAQHGSRRDTHRQLVQGVGRHGVGDPPRPLPAASRGDQVPIGGPGAGAHVPGIRRVQVTCRLQMFGYQCRVVVHGCGGALLDGGGEFPVPVGPIRSELRFVGHRANQRMPKRVLGAGGESDLIDQLGVQ